MVSPNGLRIEPVEDDEGLATLIAVRAAVEPRALATVEDVRHMRSINGHPLHLVAWLGGEAAGFAAAGVFPGTEAEDHLLSGCGVLPELRRRGVGAALLGALSEHARSAGKVALQLEVRENDTESQGFFERRGYVEVERQKEVSLELSEIDPPSVEPPPGIEITTKAARPDLVPGMYTVFQEAIEDIPGEEGFRQSYEQWLAFESRPSRLAEFTFAALDGDEVVGYAALDVFPGGVFHGLTAVKRRWRRLGVATALKRAQIAAAKKAGFERLITESEERNLAVRNLNEKLGYRPSPGMVVLRGPL